MQEIKKLLFQSAKFTELSSALKGISPASPLNLRGVSGSLLAFVAAFTFEKMKGQLVVVARDEERAEMLRDDCGLLAGEANVRFFGKRPHHTGQSLDLTSSVAQIETLQSLAASSRLIIVASPSSVVQKVPARTDFRRTILELKKNDQYGFQSLIDRLSDLGFEKKDFVEGDSVESIREFALLSQRSIRELKSTALVPALERDAAETGNSMRATLFDHVTQGAVVILDEPALIESEISELVKEGAEDIFSYEEFVKLAGNFPAIIHSQFRHASAASLTLSNQPETPDAGPLLQPEAPDPIDFGSSLQPAFNGSIQRLIAELGNLSRQEYKIALACDTKSEATRLRELIEETLTAPEDGKSAEEIPEPGAGTGEMPPPAFTILPETVHSGFIYPSSKLAFFTEHEIFGRIKRRGPPKRRRYKGFSQKELHQLKRGDFVVHTDHGIGSFAGLSKIKVGGAEQEVMKLLFLEKDVLYVNLNFINRVQKYSSQEGHIPPLSKLGGGDWERAKARAKRRIKDIARDLIGLYARRKHEKGYAFSPDTHWQKELEASFMYEDTADQARATLEVKTDMESSAPMDRLICGDVGL